MRVRLCCSVNPRLILNDAEFIGDGEEYLRFLFWILLIVEILSLFCALFSR